MSATGGGGGGGRRLPLYIDIHTTGQAEAIGAINQVSAAYSKMQQGAAGATGPMNQAQRATDAASRSAQQAGQSFNAAGAGAQNLGKGLQPVSQHAASASRGMAQVSSTSAQSVNAMNQVTGSTDKLTRSMLQLDTQMSRGRAIRTAFNENMRGMVFGMVGMFGAVNEASFMIESFTQAQERHKAAQAEVNTLVESGQKGTKEYTRAMRDLEQATRGLNFTQRIMVQSVFDIVSFSAFVFGALSGTIQRYKELRTVTQHMANAQSALTVAQVQSRIATGQQLLALTGTGKATRLVAAELTAAGTAAVTAGNNMKKFTIPLKDIQRLRTAGALTEIGNGMFLIDRNAKIASGSVLTLGRALGIIGLVIAAIVAATVALKTNFMGIRDAARGFVDWIKDMVSAIPGATAAIDALVGAYKYFEGALTGVLGKVPFLGDALGLQAEGSEAAAAASKVAAEAASEHSAEMAELSPSIQNVAKAWGIFDAAQASTIAGSAAMMSRLEDMNKVAQDNRVMMEDLAVANGVKLSDALAMSDEALLQHIGNLKEIKPTAEMAAEAAAAAAQKMADEWQASFDRIKEAHDSWGQTMLSASQTIWGEMGGKMKVGLNDLKQEVQGGFGFNIDFWEKLFPQQIADNVFRKNFNIPELIDDMKDTINRAVDKGFIEEEQAEKWFDPLMDYMENKLPDDSERAIGVLVGQMPGLMARLRPSLINGIVEIGADTKSAVDTNIVQPIVTGLKGLDQGASGLEFGDDILAIVNQALPAMRAMGTEGEALAGVFEGILTSTEPMYDTTEEKVAAVIEILGQMEMGFDSLIMGVNEDADEFADIMDNKILDAANAARLGMLLFEQDMARISGDTTRVQAIQEIIDEIVEGTENLTDNQQKLKKAYSMTGDEAKNLTKNFDGINKKTGEGVNIADSYMESIENSSGALRQQKIDFIENALGIDLFQDGLEGATLAAEGAATAVSGVGNVGAEAAATLRQIPWHEVVVKQMTDAFNALPGHITFFLTQSLPAIGMALYNGLIGLGTWLYDVFSDPAFQQAIIGGITWIIDSASSWLRTNIPMIAGLLWDGLLGLGTYLYDTFTDPEFHRAIIDGVTGLFNAWNDWSSANGEYIGGLIWGALTATATWIYDTLTDPEFQTQLWNGIKYVLETVGGWISTNAATVGGWLWGKLVDSASGIVTTLQNPQFQSAVLTGLWNLFTGIGKFLEPIGKSMWSALVSTASWIATTLQDPAFQQAVVGGIYYVFRSIGSLLQPLGETLWNGLVSTASWISTTLQDPAFQQAVVGGIYYVFRSIGSLLQPLGETLWAGLVSTASWIATTLQDPKFQQAAVAGIYYVFRSIGSLLQPLGETLWAGLVATADYITTTLQDPAFQKAVVDGIVWAIGEAGKWLATNASTIAATVGNAFRQAAPHIPGQIGAALGTIAGALGREILKLLASATTDLPQKISNFFRDTETFIGGVKAGILQLFSNPKAVPTAQEFGSTVEQHIVGFGEAFNKALRDAFGPEGVAAAEQLGQNVNEIATAIKNWLTESVGQGLADFVGSIDDLYTDFASMVTEFAQQFATPENITAIKDAMYNLLKGGIDLAMDELKKLPIIGDALRAIENAFGQPAAPTGTGEGEVLETSYGTGMPNFDPIIQGDIPGGGMYGQPPDFTEHLAKWIEYSINVITTMQTMSTTVIGIIAQMETAWTNQLANNGAQITAFITGPLTALASSYLAFQAGVVPILQAMELAWTNHMMNNGLQITAFITGPLTALATAYLAFQTGVVPIIQAIELAWTNHVVNNGAQITAFITGPLTGLASAYLAFQAGVVPIIQQMELAWTNHVANNGTQITEFIGGPIAQLLEMYPNMAAVAHENLETTNQNWAAHAEHIGNMVGEIIDHVGELASAIEDAMDRIVTAMGQAQTAAENLKAAIDNLESKTITITTRFVTQGSRPTGVGGGRREAAHGFTGIVNKPTRFIVGEGSQPEFVSVTPLVNSNKRGSEDVRRFFDHMNWQGQENRRHLERAGTGGLGSSTSLSAGPANSGLSRPWIDPASERRKTSLNPFFEDVLTYGEEKEYKKLLKKLKKKKWKPSKLNDENEKRLYEIEDKILEARKSQLDSIKSAMEQVQGQINLTTDLKSEEELEKWVATVIPPLSAAPLSMHASAVRAIAIRGRYQHHRDAMKQGRRDQLTWMEQEYDRQIRLAEELEERRLKEEEEKEDYLLEHGTKKQKKKIEKRREKRKKEERKKLMLDRAARRDFAYAYSIDRYYRDTARAVDEPVKLPAPPMSEGYDPTVVSDIDDINAARGFQGIVRRRTNITVGEHGKPERVNITPMGEETKNIADEVKQEVRHFITGNLNGLGGGTGGNSRERQVIHLSMNQPIEVKLSEQVLMSAVNKALVKLMATKR